MFNINIFSNALQHCKAKRLSNSRCFPLFRVFLTLGDVTFKNAEGRNTKRRYELDFLKWLFR